MVTETFSGINPQVRVEYPNFLVGVRCFTFNHGKYITDTMNGFCMQQTDFPFVCIIIDDASTDGEQHIIREYMSRYFSMADEQNAFQKETDYGSIIYGRHIHNKNCYFAVVLLKENHHSQNKSKKIYLDEWGKCKYYALCEGDDYWIYPMKLQDQVNWMEKHSDYLMCGSNALILWEDNIRMPSYFNNHFDDRDVLINELLTQWVFPTASLLVRSDVFEGYPEWARKIYSGDQTLALVAAYKGKIHSIGRITCVYRKGLQNSASALADKNRLFVLKEHLKLYVYYREYSGDKFVDVVDNCITSLKSEIYFQEMKLSNKFKVWIHYPLRMLKEAIVRPMFYKAIGEEKTHILFH